MAADRFRDFGTETVTVGRYSAASDLAAIPYQAVALPLSGTIGATFSALINDEQRRATYKKVMPALFIIIAPFLLVLSEFSELFIRLVLGDQWSKSSGVLKIMSLVYVIGILSVPAGPLAMALNRSQYLTARVGVESAIKWPLIVFAISEFGIEGALATQLITTTVCCLFSMWIVYKLIDLTIIEQIYILRLPAFSGVTVWLLFLYFVPIAQTYYSNWIGWLFAFALISAYYSLYLCVLFIAWTVQAKPDGAERLLVNMLKKMLRVTKSKLTSQ